jgi:inner membrane protein
VPSSVAHGCAALALGAAILPRPLPRRLAVTGVACAVLIDLDAIGRPFGRGDVEWLGGHRALTHSLFFAVIVAALLTLIWKGPASGAYARWRVFAFLAGAMIAHGILDMFTDNHPAVAIFAPFSWQRFRAPWEPFGGIWLEIFVIWIPCWLFIRYRNRTESEFHS